MINLTSGDRCFGAASAKKLLDVAVRDAINAGDIPGPRYLANAQEIARRDGELVGGITAFADGPDEMRQVYTPYSCAQNVLRLVMMDS